jgi:hypothetical protein
MRQDAEKAFNIENLRNESLYLNGKSYEQANNGKQQNIFSYYKKLENEQQQEKPKVFMPEYMEDINEVVEEEDDDEDEDDYPKGVITNITKNNYVGKNLEKSEADYDEQVDEYEKEEECEENEDYGDQPSENDDDKNSEEGDIQDDNDFDGDDYDNDNDDGEYRNGDRSINLGKGRHLNYEDVEIPNYLKNIAQNNGRAINGHMHHKSESREVVRISLSNPDSDGSLSDGEEIDENKDLMFKRPKDCKANEIEFLGLVNNGKLKIIKKKILI